MQCLGRCQNDSLKNQEMRKGRREKPHIVELKFDNTLLEATISNALCSLFSTQDSLASAWQMSSNQECKWWAFLSLAIWFPLSPKLQNGERSDDGRRVKVYKKTALKVRMVKAKKKLGFPSALATFWLGTHHEEENKNSDESKKYFLFARRL